LFFLRVLQRQKNRLQVKLDNEQIMASALPLLSVRILELAKQQGELQLNRSSKPQAKVAVQLRQGSNN
jgi:hypothetical protein